MHLACNQAFSRAFACALALALACAASGEAAAQSRQQKSTPGPLNHPVLAQAARPAPLAPVRPATARFFTINEMLAKHGMQPDPSYRLVSVETRRVLNDASPEAAAAAPEPFGLYGFRAPEGRLWKNWRALETEMKAGSAAIAACIADEESCPKEAVHFLSLAAEVRGKTGRARLETANRLANRVLRYTSDLRQHGEADRWSAPLASLATRRGDCEDYAILKYALLREAGIAAEKLRIVLLRDSASRQDHAVLAAEHDGEWLVLDNLHPAAMKTADLPHYTPLFGLSHEGVTMLASRYASLDHLDADNSQFAPATSEWNANRAPGDDALAPGGYETLVF